MFQMLLVTDGLRTYSIFNYAADRVRLEGLKTSLVGIGYNIGNKNYEAYPSRQPAILNIADIKFTGCIY